MLVQFGVNFAGLSLSLSLSTVFKKNLSILTPLSYFIFLIAIIISSSFQTIHSMIFQMNSHGFFQKPTAYIHENLKSIF